MKKNEEKAKNRVSLRVENLEMLEMLDSLEAKGAYRSKNEILNRAVEIGLPVLYNAIFSKKQMKTQEKNDVDGAKDVAAIKNIVVQQSITLNMLEYLLATLYNIEAARAEGVEVTREFLESGCLEQLPANLAEVKKEMTRVEYAKRKKDNA